MSDVERSTRTNSVANPIPGRQGDEGFITQTMNDYVNCRQHIHVQLFTVSKELGQ